MTLATIAAGINALHARLERLERAGAEIYRTDRDGTVTVRTR